jgi:uncharacterized membrane protein YoaK (UPF0700 family)
MAKSSRSDPPKPYLTPIDPGLGLLALASGSTDVMSFLMLGNTFTSAMTGNTALLAIAVGQGQLVSALLSFLALVGFVLGVVVATAIYNPGQDSVRAVLRPLFLMEIACLGCFVVAWYFVNRRSESYGLDILILLSATAMGTQAVIARHINAPGINTIVFTSTLVSIVMSVTGAVTRPSLHPSVGRNTLRQIGIFLAYGLGGLCAAYLAWRQIPVVHWIPFITVLAAIICCELTLPATTNR